MATILTLGFMLAGVFPISALAQPQTGAPLLVGPSAAPDAESAPVEPANPFPDLAPDANYFVPVRFLKEKKFMEGLSDGMFHGERPIKRAEVLAIIMKIAGKEIPVAARLASLSKEEKKAAKKVERPFRDVPPTAWFFHTVSEAKKLGFIEGKNAGRNFRPHERINAAEALHLLFAAAGIVPEVSEVVFPASLTEDSPYRPDVAFALAQNILPQKSDGSAPYLEGDLTRGQLAILLYRFIQTAQHNLVFGYASWYGDGLAHTKVPKGQEYVEKYLTAANKTLPFGTLLKVTNMSNGKQVVVVVNDRGPFVTGRIIDLSKSAFAKLEDPGLGTMNVQLEVME